MNEKLYLEIARFDIPGTDDFLALHLFEQAAYGSYMPADVLEVAYFQFANLEEDGGKG